MKKFKEFKDKYLTQKVRNIIAIFIIIFGVLFMVNYTFYSPTYINEYIASNMYKEPRNDAFDDFAFYYCVIDNYNKEFNKSVPYTSSLSDSQLAEMTKLDCSDEGISYAGGYVESTSGLEKMTSLETLNLSYNGYDEIDVSKNTKLKDLIMTYNYYLEKLDVSKNTELETLNLNYSGIKKITFGNNSKLKYLFLNETEIGSLNLTNLTSLKTLEVMSEYLTDIDLSKNTQLDNLMLDANLDEIDLSKNINLTKLRMYDDGISSIDLTENTKLEEVILSTDLEELNANFNNSLKSLVIQVSSTLKNIDVSDATSLEYLEIWAGTNFTNIDVSNSAKLEYLDIYGKLTSLDVSKNTKLKSLILDDNNLTEIDLSNNVNLTKLDLSDNSLTNIDVSKNTNLESLNIANNTGIDKIDVSSNIKLKELNMSNVKASELDVSKNVELETLDISNNSNLEEIDVSKNTKLKELNVSRNYFDSLDLSNNNELEYLDAHFNNFKEIDLSNNTKLNYLSIYSNNLTSIDVSKHTDLKILDVANNSLTELDVSNNKLLEELDVASNDIGYIDVSNNIELNSLNVAYNDLIDLDVSNNELLDDLNAYGNNFNNIIYLYKGEEYQASSNVVINKRLDSPTWKSNNTSLATVDKNGLISTLAGGSVKITANASSSSTGYYTSTTTVNIVEITSDKYTINSEDGYIYIGNDSVDNVIDNIKTSHENIEVLVNGNKLSVVYTGDVLRTLKEFNILSVSSDVYDFSKDYIYTEDGNIDASKITTSGVNVIKYDDKVYVKYGEETVLDEYVLITINIDESYKYGEDYIYVGSEDIDTSKITAGDAKVLVEDNKLYIKYGEDILKEYNIIQLKSSEYDLTNKYIYVGANKFDLNKIDTGIASKIYSKNKLYIKYDGIVFAEYDIVSLSSNVYDLTKDYLYLGTDSTDNVTKDIVCNNCTLSIDDNNYLNIIYGDNSIKLDSFVLISISSDYKVGKKTIYLTLEEANDTNDVIKGKINVKCSTGTDISCSVSIDETDAENPLIQILYNEDVIYEYSLSVGEAYVEFSDELEVKNGESELYLVSDVSGVTISDFSKLIDTNGSVKYYDGETEITDTTTKIKTGITVSVLINDEEVNRYVLSVKGDVSGTGSVNMDSFRKIIKHVVTGKVFTETEYILAADVNGDGAIKMNDAIKLLKGINA